jgi:hypothetical protein
VRDASTILASSPLAQEILAAAGTAQVRVLSDAEFESRYPGAAGVYDPATDTITLPQRIASNPQDMALVLLHELTHYIQDTRPGGLQSLGGAVAQALEGAGAVGSLSSSGSTQVLHQEAEAYLLEALVAQQSGMRATGLGVSASGAPLTYQQTLARVAGHPAYA